MTMQARRGDAQSESVAGPDAERTHALILAGGRGTRFWPLSRERRPKQLLDMVGEDGSLLRSTLQRLGPEIPLERIWVCTTADLAEQIRREVPELSRGEQDRLLVEPSGRDTAPAIAWAVWQMRNAADVVVVLPSDHWITRPQAFREALLKAAHAALAQRRIFTLGIRPSGPETGFGYLEIRPQAPPDSEDTAEGTDETTNEKSSASFDDLLEVERFVEKPTRERAEEFLAAGNFLWNAGMFCLPVPVFLDELARVLPEVAKALPGIEQAERAGDRDEVAELYEALPRVSIDYGVMEKVSGIGSVALDCGWSDLGSFESLAELLDRDDEGNAWRGDVVAIDSRDNLLVADSGTVAALGISDLAVIRVADVVLVMRRDRAQDVREIVAHLKRAGRTELL